MPPRPLSYSTYLLDLIAMENMFCLPRKASVIRWGSFNRGGGAGYLPRPCNCEPCPLLRRGRPLHTCALNISKGDRFLFSQKERSPWQAAAVRPQGAPHSDLIRGLLGSKAFPEETSPPRICRKSHSWVGESWEDRPRSSGSNPGLQSSDKLERPPPLGT